MMPTIQGSANTMPRAAVRKVVAAFDSFKGCLSAREACEACAHGIGRVLPHAAVVQLPLSDGGEGLVECVRRHHRWWHLAHRSPVRRLLPSRPVAVEVHGPLMESVTAEYAVSMDGRTAYMEMAAASGLTLVPVGRRDVMRATTYGVGELLLAAMNEGCRDFIIGLAWLKASSIPSPPSDMGRHSTCLPLARKTTASSNSRTCEIGLQTNSGIPYRSIVSLVNACTTKK